MGMLTSGHLFTGDIPAIFLRSSWSSSSTSGKFPAWKASVRKSDLPPGCPITGMEMGKLMPEVDTFGVDTAAGADEMDFTQALVGSILKPGGGGREDEKRDTPVAMPAGTDARGAPPRRPGRRSWALALHPGRKYWEED